MRAIRALVMVASCLSLAVCSSKLDVPTAPTRSTEASTALFVLVRSQP